MPSVDNALPPLDGSVSVLPGFVDYHAKHGPDRALYVFPYPDLSSNELRTISYLDFAQATHRIAHALRPKREGQEGAVVAMIMNVDTALYHAILVGLIRAGCVPFPMSPRNSAPAIASMLERIQCHRIVSQPAFDGLIASTRAALPSDYAIQIDEAPTLLSVFPSLALHPQDVPEPAPYPSPPEEPSLTSVAFYLHSSGSTGHPKPVPQTHEFVRNWVGFPAVTCARVHGLSWGTHALPPFHMIALTTQLFAPLLSGRPTSLFPPRGMHDNPPVVPTPQNTIANARKTGCHVMMAVPSFLEAWANNDDDIEYLASLKLLTFGGGPLSKVNGDKLVARGVRVCTSYGATEIGSMAHFPLDDAGVRNRSPEDWQWARIADTSKPRWVDQGDGTFELQFLTCPTHRPAIENLILPSGERGYSTSDLWVPHPTKPGLWRMQVNTLSPLKWV
ncbi:acetyl-CoA synthetase-like protein [Daedalea quercina L-15889]|uniref:Acetyl-CoA synthetase-like protein n=1 Tax=Daedalea quercina L-15889 TaxID=1314783 RepID=A0A165RBE1_9APHY|nr:acetyl-CoA synthetase-like protein [Daedalea quercina L-15889]